MKEPKNWQVVLENIREMRKDRTADVDSMGCDQCHDANASSSDQRFQKLVALMLSSQTKDVVTFAAMAKLKARGLSVSSICAITEAELGELIYPVGFWKTKAKHIKLTAKILQDTYNSDIPDNVEELCKLPGIGPKMAHLCMKSAWGKVTGIAVDTHVHRIAARLQWSSGAKTPAITQNQLEAWLPKTLWNDINALLVGFGQEICFAKKPKCSQCLNKNYCSFFKKCNKDSELF